MSLKDKNVVVTGGSRGLGLGLVEALVAHGARVTVVARDSDALEFVRARLGVATISADVTEEAAAHRILAEVRPDILALNAGAKPRMGRLDQLSWADFTATWETDVKAGLYWLQAALNLPLKPGSQVLVGSSGAAENGSPLSGGYAGAKRMLWFMAKYANSVSKQKDLGIRFQAIVPQQIVGDTGVGDAGAERLRARHEHQARRVPGPFRRADAAPGVRREGCFRAGRPEICRGLRLRAQGRHGSYNDGGSGGLSAGRSSLNHERRAGLIALAGDLRPELHRYCARLMGSVIDGEDVVQDTLVRAFVALQDLEETPPLRPWLFRIAHNRALDLLRSRAVRMAEPIDAASDVADSASPDPVEMLMRQEAVKTAVSRFAELPTLQRSVVILKDVLDELLIEIAALLDLTVDAVKGHLARGRARLREINAQASPLPEARPASAAVARYVALFNQRDWDSLRALLADDVKLIQSSHPLRVGPADVGLFFTIYAKSDGVWLAPAWLEGREVIAVFEDRADPKPSYMMWLEWRDGRISFIRDYRHVRYVAADAELVLAPDAEPASDGAAH